jgi:membrane protease YdiL (CAAX protease family)
MRRGYAAHDRMTAPARDAAEPWRTFVGVVMIAGIVIGLNMVLSAALLAWDGRFWAGPGQDGGTPAALLILLGSFGFVSAACAVTVRLLHRRGARSLLGPLPHALRDFLRVLGWLLALGAAMWVLPPWGLGPELTPNLAPGLWLMLLPLSLGAVLIQTSAEEVLFRGYLQQQIAARFRSPVIWMGLPSALFALGHYLPAQAGDNALAVALWAGVFGLLMADLTARAGNLGPAIAVHFANNLSAILIVSLPDGLSGLALYTVGFSLDDAEAVRAWLPVDFAAMVVAWLAARVAIRR